MLRDIAVTITQFQQIEWKKSQLPFLSLLHILKGALIGLLTLVSLYTTLSPIIKSRSTRCSSAATTKSKSFHPLPPPTLHLGKLHPCNVHRWPGPPLSSHPTPHFSMSKHDRQNSLHHRPGDLHALQPRHHLPLPRIQEDTHCLPHPPHRISLAATALLSTASIIACIARYGISSVGLADAGWLIITNRDLFWMYFAITFI